MVVEEWWNQLSLSPRSQLRSLRDPERHSSIRNPSESCERTTNGLEESEIENVPPVLAPSCKSAQAKVDINGIMQGATIAANVRMRRVDETYGIDGIVAAAALQGIQYSTTVPDISNGFASPSPESAVGWPALGNASQRNQMTLGSSGLSDAMDSTNAFGSTWIPGSWHQDQRQSKNNLRRRYVPDLGSEGMVQSHKHPRLDGQNNTDNTMPMQNYESQTAMTISLPTTMICLQRSEALGAEARQDEDPWDSLKDPSLGIDSWDYLRDPSLGIVWDVFAHTPTGHTNTMGIGSPQRVNNDPPLFSIS